MSSFDDLYAAHHRTLHAYFLGRTGDPELALDLLQDAFIRVWRALPSVENLPAERQRAWLFSVARNLVIDHHRKDATRRATGDALAREALVGSAVAPSAEESLVARERRGQLDRAIQQLPEDLRIVLVLQLLAGATSTQIGELLGRPAGTVRYQLAEARHRLALDLRLMEALTP